MMEAQNRKVQQNFPGWRKGWGGRGWEGKKRKQSAYDKMFIA